MNCFLIFFILYCLSNLLLEILLVTLQQNNNTKKSAKQFILDSVSDKLNINNGRGGKSLTERKYWTH